MSVTLTILISTRPKWFQLGNLSLEEFELCRLVPGVGRYWQGFCSSMNRIPNCFVVYCCHSIAISCHGLLFPVLLELTDLQLLAFPIVGLLLTRHHFVSFWHPVIDRPTNRIRRKSPGSKSGEMRLEGDGAWQSEGTRPPTHRTSA